MESIKIKEADIADLKVSSLPSRPTAPKAFGGCGYTATEMKAAFDRLPLYIIEKFNSLIDCLITNGEGSLAQQVPSGISPGHTLSDMLSDILTGAFAAYLSVSGASLSDTLSAMSDKDEESLALIATQNAKLNAQNLKITNHKAALDEATDRITAAEERITANESGVSALQTRVSSLESAAGEGVDLENVVIDCGAPADYAA